MARLTATFQITLPEPFLCERPERERPLDPPLTADDRIFRLNVNDFAVEIELGGFSGSSRGSGGGPMATEITSLVFRVTRDEADSPPVVEPAEDGTIDWTALQEYLWEKGKEYIVVVEQVIERMSAYFRFRAGHALVQLHPERGQPHFLNPVWTDEMGKTVWNRKSSFVFGGSASLHLYPRFDVTAYRPSDRLALMAALEQPLELDLYEELLADVRDAVAMGNLRRAVLELAIACEVAVKQIYFNPESYADAAYSYLEEKGRVRARVLDFVDAIAVHTFGRSLRTEDAQCFQRLVYMFRCRNRIAHRGILIFRDDQGNEVTADSARLLDWWSAVRKTIDWLKALATNVQGAI